jgi:hypothetical protein
LDFIWGEGGSGEEVDKNWRASINGDQSLLACELISPSLQGLPKNKRGKEERYKSIN